MEFKEGEKIEVALSKTIQPTNANGSSKYEPLKVHVGLSIWAEGEYQQAFQNAFAEVEEAVKTELAKFRRKG